MGEPRARVVGGLTVRNALDHPYTCYLFTGIFWLATMFFADYSNGYDPVVPNFELLGFVVLTAGLALFAALVAGWSAIRANGRAIAFIAAAVIASMVLPQFLGQHNAIVREAYHGATIVAFFLSTVAFAYCLVFGLISSITRWRVWPLALLGIWVGAVATALIGGWVPLNRTTAMIAGAVPTVVPAAWFVHFRHRFAGRRYVARRPTYKTEQAFSLTIILFGVGLGALWIAYWFSLEQKPGRFAVGEFIFALWVPLAIIGYGVTRYPSRSRRAAPRSKGTLIEN